MKTTAHFVGGPWDGRTEQLHGLPPHYNVLAPPMPTTVFIEDVAPDPEDFNRGRVIYDCREVWTWDGVCHARYVEIPSSTATQAGQTDQEDFDARR